MSKDEKSTTSNEQVLIVEKVNPKGRKAKRMSIVLSPSTEPAASLTDKIGAFKFVDSRVMSTATTTTTKTATSTSDKEDNIFEYVVFEEKYADEAIKLADRIMGFHNPVMAAMLPNGPAGSLFGKMREPLLAEGLSTIAYEKKTGTIVGARFTVDWTTAPGPPPFPPVMEPFGILWAEHDRKWAESKGEIRKGEWAHWLGIVVHEKYSKLGIATNLYKKNSELLKSKGYRGAVSENVSAFSAKAAEKAGAILISQTEYATWEYKGGKPLAVVKAPHTHFQLREATFLDNTSTKVIEYALLEEKNVDEAIKLADRIMGTRSPVVAAFLPNGPGGSIFGKMREPLLAAGLSTIAYDKKAGTIVGVRFTLDWTTAPGPPQFPEVLEPFSIMWAEHDKNWAESKGEIKKGEWGHWLGVVVHENYCKLGIATNLYKKNAELLESKGYRGAVCENESIFSAKAAEKAGAIVISQTEYATWEYKGGNPLAIVKAPHTHFQLREVTFSANDSTTATTTTTTTTTESTETTTTTTTIVETDTGK